LVRGTEFGQRLRRTDPCPIGPITNLRKSQLPPGTAAISDSSHSENPDCVSAHAMPVAVPMISLGEG